MISNHYKTNPDRMCFKCGEKLFNKPRNSMYCNNCSEIITKQQKKKAYKRYMLKEKKNRRVY